MNIESRLKTAFPGAGRLYTDASAPRRAAHRVHRPSAAALARHPPERRRVDIFSATGYEYDSSVRRQSRLGGFLLPRCAQCA